MAPPFSYPEVGATWGEMPAGYRIIDTGRIIGRGRAQFDAAAERLMTWNMQRRAGLRVDAVTLRIVAGDVTVVRIGWRALSVAAPVQVIYTVEEQNRQGFAYGTLPGHPEIGEELFLVSLDADGTVRGQVRAFSRPGSRLARFGGPVTRLLQDAMTQRYLDALASS